MTSASETSGAATAEPERVPLDRVMLAMDVVDTLRHQRELVERELDDDARRREFTQRVQRIYEAQGIEVDEDIIAEAVRALHEDRFIYRPPPRTFAVRLAEIYVERGKWALRAGALVLVVLLVWAAYAVPAHFHRQGQIADFEQRLVAVMLRSDALVQRADDLAAEVKGARSDGDSSVMTLLLEDAEEAVRSGRVQAERVGTALASAPDPEEYPEDPAKWDRVLAEQHETLSASDQELHAARRLLDNIVQLRSLTTRLDTTLDRLRGIELSAAERAGVDNLARNVQTAFAEGDGPAGEEQLTRLRELVDRILLARQQEAETRATFERLAGALAGVDLEASAAAELEALRAATGRAIEAGDWERARDELGRLAALTADLDRSYELRIATDGRSGVWRYPNDNRRARNYYIIVEAIDAGGKPVQLRITSEEDGRTRSTSKFGVRVPEAVYEAVKADKLDNGIIDERLFGVKKRGRKTVEYHFETAGGMITDW